MKILSLVFVLFLCFTFVQGQGDACLTEKCGNPTTPCNKLTPAVLIQNGELDFVIPAILDLDKKLEIIRVEFGACVGECFNYFTSCYAMCLYSYYVFDWPYFQYQDCLECCDYSYEICVGCCQLYDYPCEQGFFGCYW